jgi:rhodanese-related sulfurtransferase
MVTEVDVQRFAAAHADGAVVIDVREPVEYESGHIPGARLVPLSTLGDSLSTLPGDQPVYVVCASGNRSRAASAALAARGIDARSVAGGTSAWSRVGRPLVVGPRANAA